MAAQPRMSIDGEVADQHQCLMDIVYLTDRGGNSLKEQIFEGKYYSPYYKPSNLQAIRSFHLRNDDIYLCAFLRTGTHWIFEMVCMLTNGNAEIIRKSKVRNQLEVTSAEDLGMLTSPRVLNTHMRLSDGPVELPEKKCKIIYNLRDPKDVAVSLYLLYIAVPTIHEYHGEFKDFLYLFLEGKVECNGIFEHLRDAEKFVDENPDIPVHIQRYEETIQNPLLEVQHLSDFLGLERNDELCEAIADKCEFSKMKRDKSDYTMKMGDINPLYRKGIVGDWKNWFTDEMLENYYRVYEEKMAGSRFYERYARDK